MLNLYQLCTSSHTYNHTIYISILDYQIIVIKFLLLVVVKWNDFFIDKLPIPDTDFTQVSEESQKRVKNGLVGYDWVPDRFGPPPGIHKKDMAKIGM